MTDSRLFGARRVGTLESSLSFCPAGEGLDDCEAGPALDELFPMTSGRAAVYVTFIIFETGPGLRKPRGATRLHLGRLNGVQIDVVLPQLIAQRASPQKGFKSGLYARQDRVTAPAPTSFDSGSNIHSTSRLWCLAMQTCLALFGLL